MMTYYETLGVARDADYETIRRAYLRKALKFHPDKNQNAGAEDAFKAAGTAWSVLSDPDEKKAYDATLTADPKKSTQTFASSGLFGPKDYRPGFDALYGITIVGAEGDKKSTLFRKLHENGVDSNPGSTIAVDFKRHPFHLGSRKIDLNIWDTGGQERFRAVLRGYLHRSQAIIVVLDLHNEARFNAGVKLLREYASQKQQGAYVYAELHVVGLTWTPSDGSEKEDFENTREITEDRLKKVEAECKHPIKVMDILGEDSERQVRTYFEEVGAKMDARLTSEKFLRGELEKADPKAPELLSIMPPSSAKAGGLMGTVTRYLRSK